MKIILKADNVVTLNVMRILENPPKKYFFYLTCFFDMDDLEYLGVPLRLSCDKDDNNNALVNLPKIFGRGLPKGISFRLPKR